MDPELLKAFYDEFERRPGLLESMTESRRRNKVKLTESQLRKTIRKAILESRPHKNPRHHLRPAGGGPALGHADSTGVNCDFNSSAYQLLQAQVWEEMGYSVKSKGDWSMPDGGDGYRFINNILQCRCRKTGMIMMAVYCVDRANSENATKTSYDVYVLDHELIKDNHRNMDQDLSSDSRRWAKEGEYCTNVKQIVDTLSDAYDLYEELLDSGQI